MNPPLAKILKNVLTVPRCAACGALIALRDACDGLCGSDIICRYCRAEYERAKLEPCPDCGADAIDCACLPPAFAHGNADGIAQLALYRTGGGGVPNKLIFFIKSNNDRRVYGFLAAELERRITSTPGFSLPQNALITYVPRSREAVAEYGFDQAKMLAQSLAKATERKCLPLICRTRGGGSDQKSLDKKGRGENAAAIFIPSAKIAEYAVSGRTIILVDDVITSGASVAACAKILREAGAGAVWCAAVCKTPKGKGTGGQ